MEQLYENEPEATEGPETRITSNLHSRGSGPQMEPDFNDLGKPAGTGIPPFDPKAEAPVEYARARQIQIRKALSDRFMTAAGGPPPTPAQRAAVTSNQLAIVAAAEVIVLGTAEGREQSLALTRLEEALMWANKAVFRA